MIKTKDLIVDRLLSVAEKGDYVAVQVLLDTQSHVSDLVNATDYDDDTALIVASLQGKEQCVSVLLANGADSSLQGCSARTAAHCAAYSGHSSCLNILLKGNGALWAMRDSMDDLPLHKAASNGHVDCVDMLLFVSGGRGVDAVNILGSTPLHCAASHNHVAVAKKLLDRGASVFAKDMFDLTPYEAGEYAGHKEICELLLAWMGVHAPQHC